MAERVSDYVQRENRKRAIRSWGSALLIYLLLVGAYWGWEHFVRKELKMNQGPVLIRLGEPEGMETPPPVIPRETPAETPPEPEQPVTPPEPKAEATPVEQPKPDPVLPAPKEESTPVKESPKPVAPPVKETAPAPPEPIKGSDKGNNYELNSEGGEIGRNLWVPIAQYMPLPQIVEKVISSGDLVSILDQVQPDALGLYSADQNKAILLKYYDKKQGGLLELKKPVPLTERPELWAILERAGYDLRNAEYKNLPGIRTSPITLNFSVKPSGSTTANSLVDLEIVKSSGYPEIDEAVLFAFQQSSYYSKTDEKIKGRFTYRFY